MFYKFFVSVLLTLISSLSFSSANKVTFMILIDQSPSMVQHHKKLTTLVPKIQAAMINSRCEYRISVSNISYDGLEDNSLKPWGTPAFITNQMPQNEAILTINQRILYPELFFTPMSDENPVPNNGKEKTYSSLVESLQVNRESLVDQDHIATLLVTDAAPAFEYYSPLEAINEIKRTLGTTNYTPAFIAMPMFNGMQNGPKSLCDPDFPSLGTQSMGPLTQLIDTTDWLSKDLGAIDKFVSLGYGQRWDICDDSFDTSFDEFINLVLVNAECLLFM